MFSTGRSRFILVLVLVVGFLGGILVISSMGSSRPNGESTAVLQTPAEAPQSGQSSASAAQGKELLNAFSAAFEAVAAKVNPSVVPIFSEQVVKGNGLGANDPFREFFGDDLFRRFFGNPGGQQRQQTVRSLGSGVIVSKDGYILTNNHVVEGADKLTVQLQDKKKFTAKVIGRDPQTDIAVVKIDADNLPAASLGNSDNIRVGQWVVAVGNPFQLMHTVTAGIISAKGRSSMNLADYEDFIQTDASINPGNSGGALADLDGNVIGINTAILSPGGTGSVGIGFAVPSNMAKSIMNSLIKSGKVARGYLGLLPQDIDESLAKALHLSVTDGSLVGDVTADGPADKAGVKRGDIITAFNGTKVTGATQLRNLVANSEPGSSAKLTVLRDGKEQQLSVKLGERPKELSSRSGGEGEEGGDQESSGQSSSKLGLSVQTLTADLARQLNLQNDKGVVITSVASGSAAEDAGLRRGDLIKEVNRQEVQSVSDFTSAIKRIKKGDTAALLVRRGQNTFYVALEAGS